MSKRYFRSTITHGIMERVPEWEKHHRGRNSLDIMVDTPSGIRYKPLPKLDACKSYRIAEFSEEESKTLPGWPVVAPGCPLRLSADYMTGSMALVERRSYWVIRELTKNYVCMERFQKAQDAMDAAMEAAVGVTNEACETAQVQG